MYRYCVCYNVLCWLFIFVYVCHMLHARRVGERRWWFDLAAAAGLYFRAACTLAAHKHKDICRANGSRSSCTTTYNIRVIIV